MLYDTHVHTEISRDSSAALEDYIGKARTIGIGITPTEHLDYHHPYWKSENPDFEQYFARYGKYRGAGVYLGVEVGMQLHTATASRAIIEKYSFDHVLCSLHILDGIDLVDARCYAQPKAETYRRYLRRIAEYLPLHDYMTSLGHIDYISRVFCARYDDREIYVREYAEELDVIFKWLAAHDKALELNTRRFPDPVAIKSLCAMLRRFAECGGSYCTLGSDCHDVSALGGYLRDAAQCVRDCGLRPVYYVERKPFECSL